MKTESNSADIIESRRRVIPFCSVVKVKIDYLRSVRILSVSSGDSQCQNSISLFDEEIRVSTKQRGHDIVISVAVLGVLNGATNLAQLAEINGFLLDLEVG